jgi:hypothetical protein
MALTARDTAYVCFLAVGGAVAVLVLASVVGHLLPEALGRAALLLVLAPLTIMGLVAGLLAMFLTLWVRVDLRLWALSVATLALFVFWVRHGALGVNPRFSLVHPVGALLFSARWLAEKRARRHAAAD